MNTDAPSGTLMRFATRSPAGDEAGAPTGPARRMAVVRREGLVAGVLLLLIVGFNLYYLYAEVAIRVPDLNDGVLHMLALGRAVAALALGQHPTDPWLAPIAMGYPLYHHYQHLPYYPLAALHLLSLGRLPLPDLFNWTRYLLLSLFPLSVYWSMRRFGFRPLAASMSGLVSSLLATNYLYGLDDASYVWAGYGMYTQLWGMVLLPPALAEGYAALRTGRGILGAVVLLAAVVLSHLVFGYIALVSFGLFVLLPLLGRRAAVAVPDGVWRRVQRLALLLVLAALLTAYFFVPFLMDREFMNRSVWEEQGKYDAYGHAWTLRALVKGELFDFDRFPSLTLLIAAGLLVCLWRWREERFRLPLVLFTVWLLLYFGRPTWGSLLNLLPLTQELHLHRLIAGVHLGGILLMGIGLALPWGWALSRRDARWLLLPALLTVLVLYPVYRERAGYLNKNARWMTESRIAYDAEAADLEALTDTLWTLPPGRVYAGRPANWGSEYKVGAVPVYALLQRDGFDMLGSLYHALSLNADVQVLFDETRPEQYNLFNVRYVIAPAEHDVPAFLRPVGEFGRHRLYQATTTGYFDLVRSDLAFAGFKQGFYPAASSWLAGDLPRLKQHPVLVLGEAVHPEGGLVPLTEANEIMAETSLSEEELGGQILWERVEPGAYLATVEATRESRVMLKATYHPNWRATVDGASTQTTMVMPSFVAVTVPPGVHQVRLEYRPRALRGALLVAGLVVLGLVALAERRRETLSRVARQFIPEPLVSARWSATATRSVQRAAAWRPYIVLRESLAPHVTDLTSLARAALLAVPALWRRRTDLASLSERLAVARTLSWPSAHLRVIVGIYLLFLSVYLVSSAGHFFSTDHVSVYLTAQSLVEEGTLAIKPIHDTATGPDGKAYSAFGLGQSLVSIPLYLFGRAVDSISSPALRGLWSGPDLGDWGGTVPIFFVSLLNQFVTPLTCVLVFLFCRQLDFSRRVSLAVTLVFGFGTAAWVYARDSFQHPLESLLLLFSVYVLVRHRDHLQRGHVLTAGIAFALAVLVRISVLFAVFPLLVYLSYAAVKSRPSDGPAFRLPAAVSPHEIPQHLRQSLRQLRASGAARRALACVAIFGLPVAVVLVVIMILNQARFGHYLAFNPTGFARGFTTQIWVGLHGNLLSLGRSIFLYSPPLVLALFAFARFCRCRRAESMLFLMITALYLLAYSTYSYWHGGWSWGPRFLLPVIPLLIIPLGYVLGNASGRIAVAVLAVLGVGVQILGVAVNYSYVHWDWARMGLNPELAYLFVPDISPIPTHFRALLAHRHVDLWLLSVYQQYGLGAFLLVLTVPLLILASGVVLLSRSGRQMATEAASSGNAT